MDRWIHTQVCIFYLKLLASKMYEIRWIISAGAKRGIQSDKYPGCHWLLWDFSLSYFKDQLMRHMKGLRVSLSKSSIEQNHCQGNRLERISMERRPCFPLLKASNVKKHESNLCGSHERCSVRGYVTNPFLLFLDLINCAEYTCCKPHKGQYNNILNQSPKNQGCSQTQAHLSSKMLLLLQYWLYYVLCK